MFSHKDFMNRHQKDWWEGILVTNLFESVTPILLVTVILSFVTKSETNDVLVTVFCETVTI